MHISMYFTAFFVWGHRLCDFGKYAAGFTLQLIDSSFQNWLTFNFTASGHRFAVAFAWYIPSGGVPKSCFTKTWKGNSLGDLEESCSPEPLKAGDVLQSPSWSPVPGGPTFVHVFATFQQLQISGRSFFPLHLSSYLWKIFFTCCLLHLPAIEAWEPTWFQLLKWHQCKEQSQEELKTFACF